MTIGELPPIPFTDEQFEKAKQLAAEFSFVKGFSVRYCQGYRKWLPVIVLDDTEMLEQGVIGPGDPKFLKTYRSIREAFGSNLLYTQYLYS